VTRAQARERLGVSPDEFVYLHVGRCRPYKGLEALMTAFPQVAPPAELIIAGKFSSSAYQREILARADTLAKVLVVPRSIADDELQLYLNACDCVVLPYRAVLTSGTALLALSFGRPVIAPDMGAMRDHVAPGSGILYDPAQPDGLLRAMQDIRSRRFDAEAIKGQAREFSWSRLAGLLLDMR
jgi:glycosyltransferase involved in cell wall biosynthesis